MSDIVERLREPEELHFNPCTPLVLDNGLTMEMVHGFSITHKSGLQIEAAAEIERLRAEVACYRAQNETLIVSIAMIERAAAGSIYSQESIHAMALNALKEITP